MTDNPYLAQRRPVWEPPSTDILTIGPSITHVWDPIPGLAPLPADFRWWESELNVPVCFIESPALPRAPIEPPWWQR